MGTQCDYTFLLNSALNKKLNLAEMEDHYLNLLKKGFTE